MSSYQTFPGRFDPSPCCYSDLIYDISQDAFCCRKCGKINDPTQQEDKKDASKVKK